MTQQEVSYTSLAISGKWNVPFAVYLYSLMLVGSIFMEIKSTIIFSFWVHKAKLHSVLSHINKQYVRNHLSNRAPHIQEKITGPSAVVVLIQATARAKVELHTWKLQQSTKIFQRKEQQYKMPRHSCPSSAPCCSACVLENFVGLRSLCITRCLWHIWHCTRGLRTSVTSKDGNGYLKPEYPTGFTR
jgi:hypothetical protein